MSGECSLVSVCLSRGITADSAVSLDQVTTNTETRQKSPDVLFPTLAQRQLARETSYVTPVYQLTFMHKIKACLLVTMLRILRSGCREYK